MAHSRFRDSPWRVALALSLATTSVSTSAATATATCDCDIVSIVLTLSVIPVLVKADLVAFAETFSTVALLDVNKDVFSTIIWCDEAKALVIHELLHNPCFRHHSLVGSATIVEMVATRIGEI